MTGPAGDGLQAERTGLAWSRTSLGVAANAALLAVREIAHTALALALVPAVVAVLVAVATALYARHRTRQLRRSSLPSPAPAGWAVPLLGGSVVVLGLLTGLSLIL